MQEYKGELFSALQRLLPQHTLSRLTAKLAQAETPWLKDRLIKQFIRAFDVQLSEALYEDISAYKNFNAFFTRQLKPDARPLDTAMDAITCPADGTISQIGGLHNTTLVQAKGKTYSAEALLASKEDAQPFAGGDFATIYLSPKDYHRVHMPVSGTLQLTRYIPGKLFSVNGITSQHIPGLFARNERLVCLFDTDIGKMAIVMVGAMLVAGIGTAWQSHYPPNPKGIMEERFADKNAPQLAKGEELGHFNFGSTVILLFEPKAIRWTQNFQHKTVSRLGEKIATRQKRN